MKKSGIIIPNGEHLEPHEYETLLLLTNLGKRIELIPRSHTPKCKTADFVMDGLEWEMKAPVGTSRRTIEHSFRVAATQSENIIIDLRNLKESLEANSIRLLKDRFSHSRRVKRLKIILHSEEILDYKH